MWLHQYFNPRSHERSDVLLSAKKQALRNFNPRSHERSDSGNIVNVSAHAVISIHAPTRGATIRVSEEELAQIKISIHAPTRGATKIGFIREDIEEFQSTLPREERRASISHQSKHINFNPRSHERSDSNIAQKICLFLYNTDNKYIIR